ncbi:MAG: hypothetical protein IKO44_01585 [Ruminococcus sp.]|nr:hypothetical protein [Ruminococcus sp.]
MKMRKILAGMAAAAIALCTMTFSAFAATDLKDVAYPTEEDAAINDAYYSIGAMGFYMSQQWKWNQSEWVGINDEGVIEISYTISEVITDTTMEGKGSLGDMGVMILNLPKDNFPYNVEVHDAKFTDNDGNVTEFPEINAITEATEDPEGGWRIHIRPTEEVDEETGEVLKPATPEVAGWEEEGAFKGGTLSMTLVLVPGGFDFPVGGDESAEEPESVADESVEETSSEAAESASEVVEEESKEEESAPAESKASASKSDSSSKADDGLSTGAIVGICAGGGALLLIIIGIVVAKKRR